jgi:MORN repeat
MLKYMLVCVVHFRQVVKENIFRTCVNGSVFIAFFECSGQLVWPDCRRYCGQFVDGQFEGYGVYTQPTDDLGVEISEGLWKAGLLHGQARVR